MSPSCWHCLFCEPLHRTLSRMSSTFFSLGTAQLSAAETASYKLFIFSVMLYTEPRARPDFSMRWVHCKDTVLILPSVANSSSVVFLSNLYCGCPFVVLRSFFLSFRAVPGLAISRPPPPCLALAVHACVYTYSVFVSLSFPPSLPLFCLSLLCVRLPVLRGRGP